jgi:hypothetical protein
MTELQNVQTSKKLDGDKVKEAIKRRETYIK